MCSFGRSPSHFRRYTPRVLRRLLTVEDTFQIRGRGLLVVPTPRVEDFRGPGSVPVELRRPDGTHALAELSVHHQFFSPPPRERRWGCLFASLTRGDVPLGTEVWCDRDLFLEPTPSSHR